MKEKETISPLFPLFIVSSYVSSLHLETRFSSRDIPAVAPRRFSLTASRPFIPSLRNPFPAPFLVLFSCRPWSSMAAPAYRRIALFLAVYCRCFSPVAATSCFSPSGARPLFSIRRTAIAVYILSVGSKLPPPAGKSSRPQFPGKLHSSG